MNNPEALVIIALGLFLIVAGFKGTAGNLLVALTGSAQAGVHAGGTLK